MIWSWEAKENILMLQSVNDRIYPYALNREYSETCNWQLRQEEEIVRNARKIRMEWRRDWHRTEAVNLEP
jgi:hypothetical protein